MAENNQRRRLDEILIEQGLVTEEQIREALENQKRHGGKFGSQLLNNKIIDEAALVKALSIHYGCEGVQLSGMEIPEIIIKMIPKKVAIARKAVPFDYDIEKNMLKVACQDPNDNDVINELRFVSRGKQVKLYVAVEGVLNAVIAKYYLNKKIDVKRDLLLEIPDELADTARIELKSLKALRSKLPTTDNNILIVTDETDTGPLAVLMERDNFKVDTADSVNQALEQLSEKIYDKVFVKASVSNNIDDFIDKIRRVSPRTAIRTFQSASNLLLEKSPAEQNNDLLIKNLELFTSLLTSRSKLPLNYSARVGQYVDRLCRRLNLPDYDRDVIINAAYISDLARYYYNTEEIADSRQYIPLTIKLLRSLNYSPITIEMLKGMFVSLEEKYSRRLPQEVLGANILSIVFLFCDSFQQNEKLGLDKLDTIKHKLREQAGKLFLPEVVEAFIEMLQGEVLDQNTAQLDIQVMVYAEDLLILQPIAMRLKNEGYRTITHSSEETLIELYRRSEPDMMIVTVPGKPERVTAFINKLAEEGVSFERTPMFILTTSYSISSLTSLLERGIEDVIALDDNLDLLFTKLKKMQAKISATSKKEIQDESYGARGRLSDMSLIDLLQALGPSRKTARITVHPPKKDAAPLIIYLHNGQIIYGELSVLNGPDAIYEGLTWLNGTWKIEPVKEEDLPEPNNSDNNEAILMEGCRLIDEKERAGQP